MVIGVGGVRVSNAGDHDLQTELEITMALYEDSN